MELQNLKQTVSNNSYRLKIIACINISIGISFFALQSWAISTKTIAATVDVIGYSLGVWTSLFSVIAGSLTLRKCNRKEELLAIIMMTMPSMIMGGLLVGVYAWNLIKTDRSVQRMAVSISLASLSSLIVILNFILTIENKQLRVSIRQGKT